MKRERRGPQQFAFQTAKYRRRIELTYTKGFLTKDTGVWAYSRHAELLRGSAALVGLLRLCRRGDGRYRTGPVPARCVLQFFSWHRAPARI